MIWFLTTSSQCYLTLRRSFPGIVLGAISHSHRLREPSSVHAEPGKSITLPTCVAHTRTHTHTHTHTYIYTHTHIYIYTHTHTYIYIYIYIYSRRRTRWTWVVVTQSNNNPCPSSPSSTILRSAYMALNTLQQDWLL